MNGYQQLKKQLLPLLKGFPIIVLLFILSLVLGRLIIRYSTPQYLSIAKIKLDDQKFGFSSNDVYNDFAMFSLEHRIEAEAELLKSPIIVEKAIDLISLNSTLTRLGKLKNTILYENKPFNITHTLKNNTSTRTYKLKIISLDKIEIAFKGKNYKGIFGDPIAIRGDTLEFTLPEGEQKFDIMGDYSLKFESKLATIQSVIEKLDVKAPDKETPIIRISYKGLNPHKTSEIINAICQAYINDYVETKSSSASETVKFIDKQLAEISKKLEHSERNLEVFKTNNNVVNTTQETETGLREISKLRVDMINLEINEKAMRDLQGYIDRGEYFSETAINFGFGDLILTELVKKLKFLNDERIDVANKFTENSQEIVSIDKKIREIKTYIKEAVSRNLSDIKIRKTEIKRAYENETHMFDKLPTREKNQHILERDFMMNERVYNFLSQKRIDASILANSLITFHRIIQPAMVPTKPTSPNKTLITFVSGLLGLILGISFIYGRQFMSAKILSREDIEQHSQLPFAGIIRKDATSDEFDMLFRSLVLKHSLHSGGIIAISSAHNAEGKTYISEGLQSAILSFGHTSCQVHFGMGEFTDKNKNIVCLRKKDIDLEKKLTQLKKSYDFILLKSPPSTVDVFAVQVMKMATLSLFIIRANHTAINYAQEAELLSEEFKISNVSIVMNNAHKATNYSGNYVGSNFRKSTSHGGLVKRFKHYYKTYVRA